MSFKSLTETQILANLIDTYTSLVPTVDDMNVGSNIRSIFEAFAQELKRLYQNIQESASETQKMAAYTMFNFPLLPAQAAYTTITLSTPQAPVSDVSIPAGTTVGVQGTNIQFKTPAPLIWLSGQTIAQTLVVCTQTGSIGNRRANEITSIITPMQGVSNVTVTNPRDVRTGSDLETADRRANRFQEWIHSLHRGDLRSLAYGAKTASIIDQFGYISEQITKAQIVEGSGVNTIYVDNGYYSTSTQLIQQAQKIINGYEDNGVLIPGYKAAGIPSTVQKATLQSVNLTISVSPKTGYTFAMIQQSVIDAVTNLVQSLNVGYTLSVKDLNLTIGGTPGVLNFSHNLLADVIPTSGTLIKLGLGQPLVNSM